MVWLSVFLDSGVFDGVKRERRREVTKKIK
jgi:hypothetical protein